MRELLSVRHQEIVSLVEAGKTMPEISEALSIGRVPLFKYLKKNGIAVKSAIKDLTPEEGLKAKRLIESNNLLPAKKRLTNEELAERIGCGTTLVKKLKKRYGVSIPEDLKLMYTQDDLTAACSKLEFSLVVIPDRVVTNHKIQVRCFCGREFETLTDTVLRGNVNSCGCVVSGPQKEILEFCRSKGFECLENDKTLLSDGDLKSEQIDIYIPEAKLAIEYNGLRWHSAEALAARNKGRMYHALKFSRLAAKGIQLLTVFEDEFLDKKEVILSVVAAKLGKCSRIYARECILVYDRKRLKAFIEANHIQGSGGRIYLGLEYQGEVVAATAFRKNPRLSDLGWELSRYCNKVGVLVVGGFSRLLKDFIKREAPAEIISLSDNRWSLGKVYEMNGFSLLRESGPEYFYIKDKERLHKSRFSHRQLRRLGWDVPGQTENQIMLDRGFGKIYDCGKKTWVLRP